MPQFIKFILVGGTCVALNMVGLYLLTGLLHLHYLVSTAILTVTVNFLGFKVNKNFTFSEKDYKSSSIVQFTKYNGVSVFSFCMVLILMYVLVDLVNVWYLAANLLVSFIMAFVNFYIHKKITYT